MEQKNVRASDDFKRPVIRNVSDLVEREMRKLDAMDDNSLMCALIHVVSNILRKKSGYDSSVLMHGLDIIKQRLTENKDAHPELMPVAIVMARVPAGYIRDATYLAAKLRDVLDAHLAKSQANEWKAFVP